MLKYLKFTTRSELKRIVYLTKEKTPKCSFGQAMFNQYHLDKDVIDKINESDDFEFVVSAIYQNHISKGY